jgi:hypothetical protein
MKPAGRTVASSGSEPAPVLEVVGNAVGHVILSRGAAAVLAPDGSPILPPLVALVAAHKASNQPRSEHASFHGRISFQARKRPPRGSVLITNA